MKRNPKEKVYLLNLSTLLFNSEELVEIISIFLIIFEDEYDTVYNRNAASTVYMYCTVSAKTSLSVTVSFEFNSRNFS